MVEPRVSDRQRQAFEARTKNDLVLDCISLFEKWEASRTQAASDADEIARLKEQPAGPTFADAVAVVEKLFDKFPELPIADDSWLYRQAERHGFSHVLRDLQALVSEKRS